jgi:hypothetical protein
VRTWAESPTSSFRRMPSFFVRLCRSHSYQSLIKGYEFLCGQFLFWVVLIDFPTSTKILPSCITVQSLTMNINFARKIYRTSIGADTRHTLLDHALRPSASFTSTVHACASVHHQYSYRLGTRATSSSVCSLTVSEIP